MIKMSCPGWKTILYLFLWIPPCTSMHWIALYRRPDFEWGASSECLEMPEVLTEKQVRTCLDDSAIMPFVTKASMDTVETCQNLFSTSRWNCSSLALVPNFTPELKEGTREQAFVQSLASSALVINVARACSSGFITRCRCSARDSVRHVEAFKWVGCDESFEHADKFARSFVSSRFHFHQMIPQEVFARKIDLHNSAVGRMMARDNLRTVCKCHGASGSCAFKTCWKTAENIKVIGSMLMQKYLESVRVRMRRRNKSGRLKLVPVKRERDRKKVVESTDLVFRSISSDYCLPDIGLGSVGTIGRECHANGSGHGRCDTLCCGRGFTTEEKEQEVACGNCKFHWCCYVTCDTCREVRRISRCR